MRTRTRKRTRTRSRSRSPEDYSYGPLELRSINIGNRGSSRVVYPADDLASMYSVDRAGDDEADDAARLSATDPRGFRDLLAWDCRCVVEQRLAEFAQFKRRAQALQQTVSLHPRIEKGALSVGMSSRPCFARLPTGRTLL